MNYHKGFYSVIRYCPAPAKGEVLNIGVCLIVPSLAFREVKIVGDFSRLRKAFNTIDKNFLDIQLENVKSIIASESDCLFSKEECDVKFHRMLNMVRISKLEHIKVFEPIQSLEELYNDFVNDSSVRVPQPQARSVLKGILEKAGLIENLDKPAPVNIKAGGRVISIKVPYAYQNGAYQLLDAVYFDHDDEKENLDKIYSKSGEGELMGMVRAPSGSKYKYNVVGQFGDQCDDFFEFAQSEFKKRNCGVYRMEQPQELIEKIKRAH